MCLFDKRDSIHIKILILPEQTCLILKQMILAIQKANY